MGFGANGDPCADSDGDRISSPERTAGAGGAAGYLQPCNRRFTRRQDLGRDGDDHGAALITDRADHGRSGGTRRARRRTAARRSDARRDRRNGCARQRFGSRGAARRRDSGQRVIDGDGNARRPTFSRTTDRRRARSCDSPDAAARRIGAVRTVARAAADAAARLHHELHHARHDRRVTKIMPTSPARRR